MVTRAVREAPPSMETLSNGITLINDHRPGAPDVAMTVIVRAGSRDETRDTAGLAHLLEHLFFDGTTTRTTDQLSDEFDAVAAENNAYTDTEEVAYHAEAPTTAQLPGQPARRALPVIAELFADMLCHAKLDPDEVAGERNVVMQELANRSASPSGWLYDNAQRVAFGGEQPMAWNAIGLAGVVKAVTRDQVVAYRGRFYRPEDIAIVVSGGDRLDRTEAERLFTELRTSRPRPPRQPARWGQGPEYICDVRSSAGQEAQVQLQLLLPGVANSDPDLPAAEVLTAILGGGMSSRLFRAVRSQAKLCYTIRASNRVFDDVGMFSIATATRPQDAERAVAMAIAELRRMASEPVSAGELNRCKMGMYGGTVLGSRTALDRAQWFARRWRRGRSLEAPTTAAGRYLGVCAADVQRVAQRVVAGIDRGDLRLAMVGPRDIGLKLLGAARRPERVLGGPSTTAADRPTRSGLAA